MWTGQGSNLQGATSKVRIHRPLSRTVYADLYPVCPLNGSKFSVYQFRHPSTSYSHLTSGIEPEIPPWLGCDEGRATNTHLRDVRLITLGAHIIGLNRDSSDLQSDHNSALSPTSIKMWVVPLPSCRYFYCCPGCQASRILCNQIYSPAPNYDALFMPPSFGWVIFKEQFAITRFAPVSISLQYRLENPTTIRGPKHPDNFF